MLRLCSQSLCFIYACSVALHSVLVISDRGCGHCTQAIGGPIPPVPVSASPARP